jgi:vitamin B12 transporter
MVRRIALVGLLLVAVQAHAVIVRGKVTTALGVPLAAARVQLIRLDGGARSVSDTISGVDGAYEIRSGFSGRFLLLTSPSMLAQGIAPQIGSPFYGGGTDVVTIDVALNTSTITPQITDLATLLDVPLRQLSVGPIQVASDQQLTQATVLPELRPLPGVFVVQLGQGRSRRGVQSGDPDELGTGGDRFDAGAGAEPRRESSAFSGFGGGDA